MSRKYAGALVRHEEPATPEAIVLDNEARSALASALQTLPEGARTALVLAASGYAGAEIAAAIGRSDCRDPHDDEQGPRQAPRSPRRVRRPPTSDAPCQMPTT